MSDTRPTLPPGKDDARADEFAQLLKKEAGETGRTRSGLMRALALAWDAAGRPR